MELANRSTQLRQLSYKACLELTDDQGAGAGVQGSVFLPTNKGSVIGDQVSANSPNSGLWRPQLPFSLPAMGFRKFWSFIIKGRL